MNIGVIIRSYDLIGGAERQAKELTKIWARDHNVYILTKNFRHLNKPKEEVADDVRIKRLNCTHRRGWQILDFALKAHRELKKLDLDVVHCHSLTDPGLAGYLGGIPYVVTLHRGEMESYSKYKFFGYVYRPILKKAKKIIVVSNELKSFAETLGIKSSKIVFIPNGVDVNFFKPSNVRKEDIERLTQMYSIKDEVTIATVRRLTYKNGLDILLKACSILREGGFSFQVIIAGDGPLKNELQDLTRRLDLSDCVTFTGFIDDYLMRTLIFHSDIYVMPSRSEGFPLALPEAMAMENPVIVTDAGEMPEAIDGNGFIVEIENIQELASKLEILIKDNNLRKKFASQSRKIAEEKYSWDIIAKRTLEALKKAIIC